MTEAFLQYVWQHQMFIGELATVDGQPVSVIRTGDLNRDAGPDFFNARMTIGEMEWAGNVEIHVRASDWNVHRHYKDPVYNNVVLHVVYDYDCDVVLENGKTLPTLEMRRFLHPSLVANYESLIAAPEGLTIPCRSRVGEVPTITISTFLERLAVERLEAKADVVLQLLDECRGGWEQTCYLMMARYFGGKINALPFELLAKSLDIRTLSRWSDNRQRVEALLMGQAGFLQGYYEDDYPRALQADYEALMSGLSLHHISEDLWRFHRLHPSNFPTIRISQFADLMSQTKNLFDTLLHYTDAADIRRLFGRQAAPYWDCHYQFDRMSSGKPVSKRVGTMQADMLIINAWVPLLFVYGKQHGQQCYQDQAIALLEQIKAENNNKIRTWIEVGIRPANAAESQALIQQVDNYCSSRRCLDCRIGYNILKHKC